MRIFPRTLVSFAAVIAIQAVLAGALISRSVERYQTEDAGAELKAAAAGAFDGFNAWKLRLWRSVAALSDRPVPAGGWTEEALAAAALGAADEAGAEFAVIAERGSTRSPRVLAAVSQALPLPDGRLLSYSKDHPYIEAVLLPDGLYLVGAVRLADADLFILKRVDDHVADQLVSRPRVRTLVLVDAVFAAGSDPGGVAASLYSAPPTAIYAVLPDAEADRTRWGVVVQAAGTAVDRRPGSVETNLPVRVVTLLSKADFERRLDALQYAVVTATLFCAVITILVSFALSGNIAFPVRRLVTAMRTVRDGDFTVSVGRARPGRWAIGEIAELIAGFDDMARNLESDRRERELYLEEIEGMTVFHEELLNSLEEGVAVVAAPPAPDGEDDALPADFRIEKANRPFDLLIDPEGQVSAGRSLSEIALVLDDPDLADRVRWAAGTPVIRRLRDGRALELKIYPLAAGPNGVDGALRRILIAEDVTRRIAYEEKIFQAEKLASVSMLSAGVAHEINNPLSSILSNAQNMIEEEIDPEKAESLKLIEAETRRIARIVRELLDFSAARPGSDGGADVNETIRSTLRMMEYAISKKAGIRLSTDLSPDLPRAAIGEDALKQVLINLLRNSMQALDGPGSISVRTARTPAGSVEIQVADTGAGIDREALPRIFDPFYTTKRDGTGLGLSVVYGIVARAGGSVRAESEAGSGALMRVELPAVREKK
jgi:signal transduction histidine kinase